MTTSWSSGKPLWIHCFSFTVKDLKERVECCMRTRLSWPWQSFSACMAVWDVMMCISRVTTSVWDVLSTQSCIFRKGQGWTLSFRHATFCSVEEVSLFHRIYLFLVNSATSTTVEANVTLGSGWLGRDQNISIDQWFTEVVILVPIEHFPVKERKAVNCAYWNFFRFCTAPLQNWTQRNLQIVLLTVTSISHP